MARRYSNEDKARVRFLLEVNDGNIYRTSKETNISRATIKDWKTQWETEGVPKEVEDLANTFSTDYIANAERVRNLTLKKLEEEINRSEIKAKDLSVIWGILEDKIVRAKGLATKRVETVVEMPDIAEFGKQLGKFLQLTLQAAHERQKEIQKSDGEQAIRLALNKGE